MAGMRSSLVALAAISSATGVLGAFLNDPTQLPVDKAYDYIVVGSGPGGATVAARLSEDSSKNVLLIEAGINPDIDVHTQIPWDAASNTKRMHDWNFTTVPMPGYNGRSIDYARGKALGGSSTLNFMVWDRGPRDEWNRMAELTGDPDWSWDATQKYALKVERQSAPADGHDTSNEWDAAAHGTDGAVSVALPGFSLASGSRIIASTSEFGGEFPFIQDMSSGNSIGIGWSPSNQLNGERDSSWTAYIRPNMARPNFDVLINTYVTKVVQTGSEGGLPVFRGVEFAQSADTTTYALNATLEVILAAGAVQTPQLLMLSGIGPAAHLAQFNIAPIVPNDHVGQHLQDHPLLANSWEVHDEPDYFTYDSVRFDMEKRSKYQAEWAANRTGPLVLNCCPQIGWLRVNTSLESFKSLPDPTSGPTASHYEVIFSPAWGSFSEYPPASVFAGKKHQLIITAVISPVSRGEITLQSADPWAAPLINPNFLGDAEGYDAAVMREAVKAMLKFSTSKALSDYLVGPVGELAAAAANGTDEAFTEYVRNWSTTVWHPASTAKMAPWNSTDGVLNPDLTVKGTIGLRVVDLSAFPRVTASHPMFPLYIVAERASDLIKAAHP